MLGGGTQFLQSLLAACLTVNAHYGFGPGQAVADPRSVFKDEFQSVGADDLAYRMAAKLARIGLQLFSELCLDLGRQSEILPLRIEGTNFVTDHPQLLFE